MNRVPSGIPGLDKIIGGGIPEQDIVLLSGECGTGKTIFGMQFLSAGGVYVSFEDETEKIEQTAEKFGWDFRQLQKQDKMRLVRYDPFKLEDIIEIVQSLIREIGSRKVVLDSVSALGMYTKDISDLRRMILQLETVLRKNNCTGLLISEIVQGSEGISRFGVEEFVTDGVITMRKYISGNEYRRGLTVAKMRGTEHSNAVHSYEISKRGISVGQKMKM